jgi:hypothetical protein
MIIYREVKSEKRLPTILPKRRKFVLYKYDDGTVQLGLEVPDEEEPYQYWLEKITE